MLTVVKPTQNRPFAVTLLVVLVIALMPIAMFYYRQALVSIGQCVTNARVVFLSAPPGSARSNLMFPTTTRMLINTSQSTSSGSAAATSASEEEELESQNLVSGSNPSPTRFLPSLFLQRAEDILKSRKVDVSLQCHNSFGRGFMNGWLDSQKDYCMSPAISEPFDRDAPSRIDCFPRTDIEVPLTLCVTRNTMITDSTKLFQGGSFKAFGCQPDNGKIEPRTFGTTPRMWFVDALQVAPSVSERKCEHWVTHPVIFLFRWDVTNMFHATEDFVTTFLTLHLAERNPEFQAAVNATKGQVEVVIVDKLIDGYFLEFWQHLAGSKHKLRLIALDPYPPNTCFTNTFHNVHGGVSLLSYSGVGRTNTCPSVLLMGYSLWARMVLDEFVMGALSRGVKQNPAVIVHNIVLVVRSRFEKMHKIDGWQSARVIQNEHELVDSISKAVLDRNYNSCIYTGGTPCTHPLHFWHLDVLEFSDLLFGEQVVHTSHAQILIAMHGAGLAHTTLMDPTQPGAVIELKVGPVMGSHHFHNIAHWMGFKFATVNVAGGSADMPTMMKELNNAIEHVEKNTIPPPPGSTPRPGNHHS